MADTTEQAWHVTDQASDKGQEVAEHAADQARAVKESTKEQVSEVADKAAEHGRNVLGDLRSELSEHGDRQAGRASEALYGLSSELEQMVEGSDGQGPAHDLAREAAHRADSVAHRLDEGGINGVLDDVQRFARRRPGLFLLAAAGTGFAVGRLARNTDLSRLKDAAKSKGPADGSDGGELPGTTERGPDHPLTPDQIPSASGLRGGDVGGAAVPTVGVVPATGERP